MKSIMVGCIFLLVLFLALGCCEDSDTPQSKPEKIYSQGIYDHVEYKTSDTNATIYTIIYYDGSGTFIAQEAVSIPASKGDLIKVVENEDASLRYKVVRVEDKSE